MNHMNWGWKVDSMWWVIWILHRTLFGKLYTAITKQVAFSDAYGFQGTSVFEWCQVKHCDNPILNKLDSIELESLMSDMNAIPDTLLKIIHWSYKTGSIYRYIRLHSSVFGSCQFIHYDNHMLNKLESNGLKSVMWYKDCTRDISENYTL